MCTPSLQLVSQPSPVLWVHRTPCCPFGFLSRSLGLVPIPRGRQQGLICSVRNRYYRPRQVLRPGAATVPSPIAVPAILSAACHKASTRSNLIIISRLNHFACAPALSLPVLRLNLMLPLRLQGLGTGGWLGLARQGFPTRFRQLTNVFGFIQTTRGKQTRLFSQLAHENIIPQIAKLI